MTRLFAIMLIVAGCDNDCFVETPCVVTSVSPIYKHFIHGWCKDVEVRQIRNDVIIQYHADTVFNYSIGDTIK